MATRANWAESGAIAWSRDSGERTELACRRRALAVRVSGGWRQLFLLAAMRPTPTVSSEAPAGLMPPPQWAPRSALRCCVRLGDGVPVGAGIDGNLENPDKRTPPGRVASCARRVRASRPGLVTKLGGVAAQMPAERLGVLERRHRRHPAAQDCWR